MPKQVLMITAPHGGIGEAITRFYSEKQGSVILGVGRESGRKWFMEQAKDARAELMYFTCDCTSHEDVVSTFREAREVTSELHGLVHLVGGSLVSKGIDEYSPSEFQRVLDVNLMSSFYVGKEAFSWMKEKSGGNIVFFSSTTAFEPVSKKMAYGVAKAGVNALTTSFALEGGKFGVITNAIAPCYVMTKRHERELQEKAKVTGRSLEELITQLKNKNPLQKVLYPNEIVPVVDLLLTTKEIHGQIIRLDLGQILHF